MSEKKKPTITCPGCGAATTYFTEPAGPFCSTRCQMLDLGRWLGEEYRISEPLRPEHFAAYEDLANSENPDRPDDEA